MTEWQLASLPIPLRHEESLGTGADDRGSSRNDCVLSLLDLGHRSTFYGGREIDTGGFPTRFGAFRAVGRGTVKPPAISAKKRGAQDRKKRGVAMSLVVISREMGSGGTQIGKAVAERLGYRFVDREVILEAARRYEVREEKLARLEESKPTFWERFDHDRERYLVFLQAALYSFAAQDNTVIAGRAAPLLLQGIAHALRVRITAPLEVRAARVAEEEHITQGEAEKIGRAH